MTAQQNAERYYKKAKNINLEIDNLNKSRQSKEKLLSELQANQKEIEESSDYRTLRKFSKSEKIKSPAREVPYKTFIINGYAVYVGNNARQNDRLTLKFANKNDLFFHAKDVSGSHVILKPKPGTNVPQKVLEATASIAAYYSKRKTDSLCPVGYKYQSGEYKVKRNTSGSQKDHLPDSFLWKEKKCCLYRPGYQILVNNIDFKHVGALSFMDRHTCHINEYVALDKVSGFR